MYNNGNSSKNVTGTSVVDGTLENADYPDNGLSGDKIDGGIISNFQSTGIDDRLPTDKVLPLEDNDTAFPEKSVGQSIFVIFIITPCLMKIIIHDVFELLKLKQIRRLQRGCSFSTIFKQPGFHQAQINTKLPYHFRVTVFPLL